MYKTKLGTSVGLLGAIIYFSTVFGGGYFLSLLLCGYVLLVEDNPWLRRSSIKAVLLLIAFSLLSFIVEIIPSFMSIIQNIIFSFGGSWNMTFISGMQSILTTIISIIRYFVFILLGFKALSQGSVRLPFIEKIIDKHTGEGN